MGKATVIENIGAGRYKIDVDVGSAEKAKVLETLNNARIKLELESFTVYNKLTAKEAELETATENHRVIVVEIEFFYIAKDGQIQALRNDLFSLENEYDTESNKEYTFNLNYNNALFLLNQFKKELNDLTVERDSYVAINNSYRDTIKNFQEEINQRQNSINTLDQDLNIFENILSDKENDLITAKANAESLTQQLEEIANPPPDPQNPQTNNYFLSGEAILSLLAKTGLFSTITIQDILTDKEAAKTQAKEILRSYYDDELSSLGFISNVNRALLSELTPTSSTPTVQNVSFGIVYDVNTKFYDRLAGSVQDDEELIEQLENLRTNGKTISNGAFEALKTTISTKGNIKLSIVSNAMDTMASNKLLVFKDVANYAGIETISNALIENRFNNAQTDVLQQELSEVYQVIRVAETAVEVVSSDVESLKNNINILEEEINDLESQLKSVEIQQEDNEFFIYKLNGDGIDFIDNLVESLESENDSLNERIQSNIQRIEDLAEDPNSSLEINLITDENNYLQSQIANNNVRKAFYNGLKPEVLLFISIPVKEAEIVEQNKLVRDTSRELFGQKLVLADVQKRIDKKMKEINAKETEQAPKALTTKLNALEQILSKVSAQYDALNTEYKYMKLKLAEMARRITYIQGFNGIVSKNAWCVDFTDDISVNSQVATIEVPGEPQLTLIGPGGPTPTALDGRILARQFQDPNQLYFNAAILPGLLKWRPSYRRGTITSINKMANTANVTLAPAEMASFENPIDINVSTELVNVPILYLDCNSDVFEVNDQVVVKFMGRQWDTPRIIGFVTDPKECSQQISFYYTTNHYIYKKWVFPTGQLLNGSWEVGKYFSGYLDTVDKYQSGDDVLYVAYNKWPHCIRPGLPHPFSGNIRVYNENNFFYAGYLPSNISGLSAKKVGDKWYIFAAVKIREYYLYNPPLNNLRLYRGELLGDNGYYYIDWVIISTFDFEGVKTFPGRTIPEAYLSSSYWQSAPTSFNQSCTQAYQLILNLSIMVADHRIDTPSTITDGSYAVKFTISGISATNEIAKITDTTSSAPPASGNTDSPQNYGPREYYNGVEYVYDFGPREYWGIVTYGYIRSGTLAIAIDFVGDTLTLLTHNYDYSLTYNQVESRNFNHPHKPFGVYYQTYDIYNTPRSDNYGFVNSSGGGGSLTLNWSFGSSTFSWTVSSANGSSSGDKYIIGWDPKCNIITWVDWRISEPSVFKVNDETVYTYPAGISPIGGSGFSVPTAFAFSAFGNLFSCARFNQTYHQAFRAPIPTYQESYYLIEASNGVYNAGYKLTEDMVFFRSSDNSVSKSQVSASIPNGLIEQAPIPSAPNRIYYNFYRIYITFKN